VNQTGVKTYCFDIDGTICTDTNGDYASAKPFELRIAHVNALHGAGNTISFFTARGSTTGIDWRALTEEQLVNWGVNYHSLIMGKPHADLFIDDKAIRADDYSW